MARLVVVSSWQQWGGESLNTLPLMNASNPHPASIVLEYGNPATDPFTAVLSYNISVATPNNSVIDGALQIENHSGSNLDLHLFNYLDPGLGGSMSDHSAMGDETGITVNRDIAPGQPVTMASTHGFSPIIASSYEIGFSPDILDRLNDENPTTLASTGFLFFGPADLSLAFQYDLNIADQETVSIFKVRSLSVPVPEPLSILLYGIGLFGVAVVRKRNNN